MKVLVVIDMQNDFITGPLGTKEAQEIVPKVIEKVKWWYDGPVMYTLDTHNENYLKTQEGKNLPILHCLEGSDGWKIPNDLQAALERKGHWQIRKNTFGTDNIAFHVRDMNNQILGRLTDVVLVGVCTDICVISNALLLKSLAPEVRITVDASCCAGTSPEAHETALKAMQQCQIFIENRNI